MASSPSPPARELRGRDGLAAIAARSRRPVAQFRHMPPAWQAGVHSQQTSAGRACNSGYMDGDATSVIGPLIGPCGRRPVPVIYVTPTCRKTCHGDPIYGTLVL
jgi:hypothetical protein